MPPRLHSLVVQQTGLSSALLADPTRVFFPEGTLTTARRAAAETLATLQKLGPNVADWAWGKIHIAHWKHPIGKPEFDIGPAPIDGGSHTIRNTGGELPPHGAASGAEYRMVMDFAEPDRFLAVQNIGNSGIPGHPHYRDQFEPFLRGDYHTVHLKRENISPETITVLSP